MHGNGMVCECGHMGTEHPKGGHCSACDCEGFVSNAVGAQWGRADDNAANDIWSDSGHDNDTDEEADERRWR